MNVKYGSSFMAYLPDEALNFLRMQKNNNPPQQPAPLVENLDYYIERGCWVFTEAYHLRRGHCCGSGCRHCPYRLRQTPENLDVKSKNA